MKPLKILLLIFIFSLFSLSMLNSCKDNSGMDTNVPGQNEVWMQNTAFVPATKTISVGTTITWINKDSFDHDVTSSTSGLFQSGNMGKGATYSHQFNTAGTFDYTCTFHPGMIGKIVVQ